MVWHEWLLIICFIGTSALALFLSWQWCYRPRWRRRRRRPYRPERPRPKQLSSSGRANSSRGD